MKPGLSAVIITKNEAHRLGPCLESVAFCNEIIVVDSGSTDGTVELAQRHGCRVSIAAEWPGFGVQKQRSLDLATHDWILSIDADEVISGELRAAIQKTIAGDDPNGFVGYRIRRLNFFLGVELRFGGWGGDEVVRLARRTHCRFSPDRVHEQLLVSGRVGSIHEPMFHHARASLQDVLEKQGRYAVMAREASSRVGERPSMIRSLVASWITFLNFYVLRLGFLDGKYGFFAAASRAQGKFWKQSGLRPISNATKPVP